MKLTLPFFISILSCSQLAWSQEMQVSAEQLGQLRQDTAPILRTKEISGSAIIAEVINLPGQAYVLTAPMNVQQIQYMAALGEPLKKGDEFAVLRGPEVHHYYSQYQIYRLLYTQSKKLFENNEKLFMNKAINEASWLQISQQYYDVKLAYDEYVHFFEYVSKVDEKDESLTLVAPVDGIVSYESTQYTNMGQILARFIPNEAIVFKLNVSADNTREIESIETNGCKLSINSVSQQLDGFYQTAYTEPLHEKCLTPFGARISVSPKYKIDAYIANKESVFNWQGDNYIFIKDSDTYKAIKINVLGAQDQSYVIQSDYPLNNKDVLISSVSAAQGILMGLGE